MQLWPMGTIMFFYNHAYDVNIHLSTIMIALLVKHFLYKYFNCTIAMSAVTLHKISYHQNDILTCIAITLSIILYSLFVSTKCQHYITIVIVLIILWCITITTQVS